MSFYLVPSPDFRYSFKKGMKGTDVAALQINLGKKVNVDGDFGPSTERAVKRIQEKHNLVVDGIAGPATQEKLVSARSYRVNSKYELPKGTLKSIASNESGLFVASMGFHSQDAGADIGAFARSTGKTAGSQDFLYSAYNVKKSADWTARNLLEAKLSLPNPINSWYKTHIGKNDEDRFLWQLAIFSHNWPAGADRIARYGQATTNDDIAPANNWISIATAGRLTTPREWVVSYIERATVYIKW